MTEHLLSSYVLKEDLVEPKPVNLSFEQAAAIPLAGNTALICVRDAAQVQRSSRS